ncbi:unnamed protein product, partial [marine sediment metagenome]
TGFVEPNFVQIENNLWSFFTICRFEKSNIIIGKAHEGNYIYRKSDPEKNPKVKEDFINYILTKLNNS